MARKRIKKKKCSCKVCKPGKTGQSNRWSPKYEAELRLFERSVARRELEFL